MRTAKKAVQENGGDNMLNYKRYKRVPVVDYPERQWPNNEIKEAPIFQRRPSGWKPGID